MPNDPGPSVQLNITPVGSVPQGAANPAPGTYPQGVYAQPNVVMVQPAYPVYAPAYYDPPYYDPPVRLNLGLGYWGGYYGGYRRHH
jgi:hypothetical protein